MMAERIAALFTSLLLQAHFVAAFLSPNAQIASNAALRHSRRMVLPSPLGPKRFMLENSSSDGTAHNIHRLLSSSLVSDYAVRINAEKDLGSDVYTSSWEFHPLQNWKPWNPSTNDNNILELDALDDCAKPSFGDSSTAIQTISCTWEGPYDDQWYIEVDDENAEDLPKELVCIMSRVLVQSAASRIASLNHQSSLLHLTLPTLTGETFQEFQCSQLIPALGEGNDIGIRQLFQPLNADYANMEIVDMVNQNGDILGSLPRPFVHTYNILHRGIGMIVSQDVSILDRENFRNTMPNIYVHQRTDTKRIFPSMYDMFVGGVSCRGESAELTAAREVAEELGLKGALEFHQDMTKTNPLSAELFKCVVCTGYNRCVVSMFAYQCISTEENISWQEEEVQWGEFVPYHVIEAAAALSIARLKANGSLPMSSFSNLEDGTQITDDQIEDAKKQYTSQAWDTWDFVPDGLLVWEAFLQWSHSLKISEMSTY